MKITKGFLKNLIKEEMQNFNEQTADEVASEVDVINSTVQQINDLLKRNKISIFLGHPNAKQDLTIEKDVRINFKKGKQGNAGYKVVNGLLSHEGSTRPASALSPEELNKKAQAAQLSPDE